jgi:L-2,4-diaminobutyrate decarboxylase
VQCIAATIAAVPDRPVVTLHHLTPDNEALARQVFDLALQRRRDPPPLNAPQPAHELQPALAAALCAQGVGGSAALQLFTERIVPASISADHPGFLAFIPHAPTEAAIYADWLLSAFPSFTGAWHDGAGIIAAENAVLAWLAGLAGLPAAAGGSFVPGATLGTLAALHAARHQAGQRGGAPAGRRAVITSREAHASVAAATRVLDVDLITVEPGAGFVLTGASVRAALQAAGPRAFAVVASAGTTNLGVIDDLPGIAAACREAGAWLHVDAAYGGAVLVSPAARGRLAGIEQADSLVIDPHKWLFAPYDSCALLFRQPALAAPALAQQAEYIDPVHGGVEWNPFNYGIQLSRRGRGLPLWFSLATYGTGAYAAAIDASLALTQQVVQAVRAEPLLELAAEPMLSVVAFHRHGWSAEDCRQWSQRMLREGLAWIAPSSVRGRPALRLCLLNPRASMPHIAQVLATLR